MTFSKWLTCSWNPHFWENLDKFLISGLGFDGSLDEIVLIKTHKSPDEIASKCAYVIVTSIGWSWTCSILVETTYLAWFVKLILLLIFFSNVFKNKRNVRYLFTFTSFYTGLLRGKHCHISPVYFWCIFILLFKYKFTFSYVSLIELVIFIKDSHNIS